MARILVLDDESSIRTILEHTLTSVGHEVLLAKDAKEAMNHCRALPVDVAIIDLFMPDQDGLETITAVRGEFPDVAIIAISGRDPSGAMLSVAAKLGAARTLEKPFDATTLMAIIEDVLRSKGPRN